GDGRCGGDCRSGTSLVAGSGDQDGHVSGTARMSGCDKDWLSRREPAGLRARYPQLLATAIGAIERAAHPCVIDIGCGTGSTYRALRAGLTTDVRWRLLDHDEGLLAEAESRHGGRSLFIIRGD